MANDIKLQEGHPVDENLRPIKVGGKSTALEVAQHGNGARITGDLEVTGDIKGNIKDIELDLTKIVSTDLLIDDSGDITLDAAGGDVNVLQADLTMPSNKKVIFGAVEEYILGNTVNLHIASGGSIHLNANANITLTAANDINIPADVGLTFGDDGEKIEGDGTNLTISSSGDINIKPVDGNIFFYTGSAATIDMQPSGGGAGGAIRFNSVVNTDDYSMIYTETNGVTTISTVDADASLAHLTLDVDGTIILDSDGGEIILKDGGSTFGEFSTSGAASTLKLYEGGGLSADDYLKISVEAHGVTTISTVNSLGIIADFILDIAGDIVLDSGNGIFIAKQAGTEFSATNSSYAGMILGYTDIGLDEAAATYNLTTGYIVPTSEFKVTFKIPPSGNVEIFIQIGLDLGSGNNGDLYAGLSTASSYTQLEDFHEVEIFDGMSRGALRVIRHSWTLTGLTSGGDEEEIWVGFKSSSTLGTPHLQWGSNASNVTSDFIMKAIALPATIAT